MRVSRRQLLSLPLGAAAVAAFGNTSRAPAQASGTLRVAHVFLPALLDPTREGFNLIEQGMAETLTRINPELQVEPWLAESVSNVDPTTWEIKLRADATFWDGSTVDADAVIASFQENWTAQPDATNFIDARTQLIALDQWTIRLVTPSPVGNLPNNLASFHFIVHKQAPDSTYLMTSPYVPIRLIPDQQLELEAYAGHWDGTPAAGGVDIRLVSDANTRVLALQSGEVDMISQVPPELLDTLPAKLATAVVPNTRVHQVLFNFESTVAADQAVRTAFSTAIDRAALNDIALNGQGAVTTGPFPTSFDVSSPLPEQADVAAAEALLEQAGWVMGDDGVRVNDGQRLNLLLATYPGRPELTPMAVAIQDQLNAIGFAIAVREVEDISTFLEHEPWDASMWSLNPLPTADPLYLFNTALVTDGIYNPGKYSNPDLDAIATQLQTEPDPAARLDLTEQAQAIAVDDAAVAWLLSPPRAFAYNPEVMSGMVVSPNDLYMIDGSLTLTS